ncbi:predicted protein [Lichtheimia corymbifera JMRC:FSU:9682]|uniref:Uncharacterized protein n=1 Tax=Lichtheimia corymbifera JMRC:FSU:9682 TaxID=1263082 RepID=A0A068S0X1_9FUNG|nr:predicted protein [Lichtheimia corymbifera JMRC:FSU:9682]
MTQATSASFPNVDVVLDPFAASPFTSIVCTTLGYSTTIVRMQLLAAVTGDGGGDVDHGAVAEITRAEEIKKKEWDSDSSNGRR